MLDLVIYGATGFTAGFVVKEIAQAKDLPAGFTWGISGRNAIALKALQESLECNSAPIPEVMVVDVTDEPKLLEMARQTKVVLNCVGPFSLFGEPVVKACIKGHTNYLDIAGEPEFIERMHLRYHRDAVNAGVTILHAAAFDSLPCDLGVLETKKAIIAKSGVPYTVDMFCRFESTGRHGVNYTTFQSAVHGFSQGMIDLTKVREDLSKVWPSPKPIGKPSPIEVGWFGAMKYPRIDGYLVPYFVADPSIVHMSQVLDIYLVDHKKRSSASSPVHFNAYFVLPTLWAFLLFKFYFSVFLILVTSPWGRKLLLAHPKFFTHGVASFEGPSKDQMSRGRFSQIFIGKGVLGIQDNRPLQGPPNVSIVARIDGAEAGYVATPHLFVTAALKMLHMEKQGTLRRGVLTSAIVFRDEDLLSELSSDSRFKWSVRQTNL